MQYSSYSAHANIAVVCALDLVRPKSSSSLKAAFSKILNPSLGVNTVSPEEAE